MNVFYEDEGALKVGAVLTDNTTSLQVEAPHGKRSKIKAAAVVFRFEHAGIGDFLPQAQRVAEELDPDFLWQCSNAGEFGYDTLAREYFGREPTSVEAAGVLLKLHGAPMYFYKRGRGRYKAAPEEALKAALAGMERKKQQALKKDSYVSQLSGGALPAEFQPLLGMLLYRPDKNSSEWKALEEASVMMKLTPARVIERCGGVPSTHDYHLNCFLFEHFPRVEDRPAHHSGEGRDPDATFDTASLGSGERIHNESSAARWQSTGDVLRVPTYEELPLSDAIAFSIDDASTTEIDDAFSVTPLPNGNVRIGIHIAAPALGISVRSPLDHLARERLSTVYFPGGKITMLPPESIAQYTLAADSDCPVLSHYVELTPQDEVVTSKTKVERVRIGENMRHESLEHVFNEGTLAAAIQHARGAELQRLWQWVLKLEHDRRGDVPEGEQRPEYAFSIVDDRVRITRRARGTPIDKLVSELMIYVNAIWAGELAQSGRAAIYRVQTGGKVRMSTVPAAHTGLSVPQYLWASSPLRRYIDLVNQRQLIALALGADPPYHANDETLLAIMREFESAYDVYGEFQRTMERYWCLRWLIQERVTSVSATVLRENLCRFDELPLVARVASLPSLRSGARVALELSKIDLFELTFHCEFERELDAPIERIVHEDEMPIAQESATVPL